MTAPVAEITDVEEAMKDVVDPELGINVVDLGLVYGIHIDETVCVGDWQNDVPMHFGGKPVASTDHRWIELIDPSTARAFARTPNATKEDVDAAVNAAQAGVSAAVAAGVNRLGKKDCGCGG